MLNPTTSLPSRAAATASAFLLVTASAGFGCVYAWTSGQHHGPVLAGLAVCMAAGLELAKPLAVVGALSSLRAFRFGQALALAALAAAAVLYSLTAELSLVAQVRGDAAAERSAEGEAVRRKARDYQRTEQALAALAPARPAAELRADIAAIDALPGIVVSGAPCGGPANGPTTKQHCPQRAALQAELGRAEERQRLEARLAGMAAAGTAAAPRVADPGPAAVAAYLGALGFRVSPELLAQWMTLIAVLALEIGSATAGLLVRAGVSTSQLSPVPAAVHEEPTQPVHTDTAVDTPAPVASALPAPSKSTRRNRGLGAQRIRSKAAAADAILDAVKGSGGRLDASTRGLAAMLKARRSTVHNAVMALMAGGVLVRAGSELVLQA
ncbi:MAG: hypothetical protein AB7O65_10165 [Candidatus Korobacteraceae bacterium]